MRQRITSLVVSISLILPVMPLTTFAAFHENRQEARQEAQDTRQEKKGEVKDTRQEKRGEMQDTRQEAQDTRQDKRGEMKDTRQEKKGEMKDTRKEKRGEAKDDRQQQRQEAQEARKQEVEKRKQESTEKRAAKKEEMKQKREDFKAKAQSRKEELKKKVGEKRAANIEKFFNQMMEKMEAASGRLTSFADRIGERITKAKDSGKDVTEVEAKLLTARDAISAVDTAITNARASYATAILNEDLKAAFQEVRGIVGGVAQEAKEAQQALVDTVKALQGVRGTPIPATSISPIATESPSSTPVE